MDLHTSCFVFASVLPDLDDANNRSEHAEEQCPDELASHIGATCVGSRELQCMFANVFLPRRPLIGTPEPSLYVVGIRQSKAHKTNSKGLRRCWRSDPASQNLMVSLYRSCRQDCAGARALEACAEPPRLDFFRNMVISILSSVTRRRYDRHEP